jgi:F0F1-type ATP synthase delta subunit
MSVKNNSLVRELMKSSTNDHGVIESSLVEKVISSLREINPPRHLEILKVYLIEIRKSLRLQLVEVELGCQPNDFLESTIKDKINSLPSSRSVELQVSQNDNLIAGYRIRLVDDVFEDSIQSRLAKLSQSFTA